MYMYVSYVVHNYAYHELSGFMDDGRNLDLIDINLLLHNTAAYVHNLPL